MAEGQEGKQGGKDGDWNKRWGDQSAPRLQDKGLGSHVSRISQSYWDQSKLDCPC